MEAMPVQAIENLVSIVVPFYNSARFIRETIESVLAQTFEDWELLLMDDGSVDESTQIAMEYAARYPNKIRCYDHPGHANLRAARTRNAGARLARGEFLAFLDSDDVWLPNKLADQVERLREFPEAGLVFAPSLYWYDWDGESVSNAGRNHVPAVGPVGLIKEPEILLIEGYPVGKWGAPCPSSFLLRRSAFEDVGGFPEEFARLFEDVAFLSKLYIHGVPVFISECTTDYYRCHEGSVWHRIKGTKEEEKDRAFYFRWLHRYLRERQCEDARIWRAVRREGWTYWLPLPVSIAGTIRRMSRKSRWIGK
ncbi:MAG: glycosyltransferase family 2 protein [Acidobacteriaceae bacterium]